MPVSQQDLGRDLNLLLKVLQDFNSNVRIQGSSLTDFKENVELLGKSIKSSGLDYKYFGAYMKKLVAGTEGWSVQASNIVRVFEELKKEKVDYGLIQKLMSPKQFQTTLSQALTKVKAIPVLLNTKENLSLLSKAIAKGNKDYAATGFGKVTADFYKNASNKQIAELYEIRKKLQEGISLKDDRSNAGLLAGILTGVVAQTGDVIMENAGFGELPGKFINVISAGKALFGSMKTSGLENDKIRNAMLMASVKASESAYNELVRINESAKEDIVEAEAIKNDKQLSVLTKLGESLNKTSFSESEKNALLSKAESGKLTKKDITAIMQDWKTALGEDFGAQDEALMKEASISLYSGIKELKEIDKYIGESKNRYTNELKKENESLVNLTKSRGELDKLMKNELKGQFKEIDRYVKKVGGPEGTQNELKRMLQQDALQSVRSKFGLEESEEKGTFGNTSVRLRENLSQQGFSESSINSKLNNEFKNATEYNERFSNMLKEISPSIFGEEVIEKNRKITRKKSFNIPTSNKKPNSGIPPISTIQSLPSFPVIPPQASPEDIPNIPGPTTPTVAMASNLSSIPSPMTNVKTPTRGTSPIIGNQDEAFEKLEQTSEVLQKTYDLFKNIYGEDGSKFADKLAEKLSNKIFKVNLEGHYDGNNNTQESGTSSVPDAGE